LATTKLKKQEKNEFLEKEIKEIAEKFTMATPSKFERRVKRAAKVGNAVISEFLTKIQASIARQEESIEALRVSLKVLMKKGKEGHPSVALVQERVVAHNRESDPCRMLLEDVNFLKLKLEGDKGESLFELTNVEIPLQPPNKLFLHSPKEELYYEEPQKMPFV